METRPTVRQESVAVRPYEPNTILRWFYDHFFTHIQIDERWSNTVRESAKRGVVVYVMRSISFLDFLCLDFLTKRFALPLVRFVNDLGLWILEPFGKGGRRLRLRRQLPEEQALADTVHDQFSALLFLRRPPKVGETKRHGRDLQVDLIKTLVETQRRLDKPILLLPQTFVWTKLPSKKKATLFDLIFGPSEWPGRVRVFFQFLLNFRNALLRSGEPFDLSAFIEEHQDLTDVEVADKVRYALLRRMEREREVVLGPKAKTPGRISDELLRSRRVRKHIEAQARATNKSIESVEKDARKELKRLCANQSPYTLAFFHRILEWVWTRVYDGLEVDEKGIERLREYAREGSLVFLPSHKSHIDYLTLSDVLYTRALSPPLIAAGDNLDFWPVGPLLRGGGAFYIRRSFRGKKLYSVLVEAYMRKLLVEGFNIEFFLEGGRSRTGKLLPPKFGLLSMVVDACTMLPGKKVFFVPISIGYERVIEGRSYVDEQAGTEKKQENIGGLLKTGRVLRSRYGRLYVEFGEPLGFDEVKTEIVAERRVGDFANPATGRLPSPHRLLGEDSNGDGDDTLDGGSSLRPSEKRALVQRIAHRVMHRINEVTVVTPAALVATALLAHRRRGISRGELVARAEALAATLVKEQARFAGSILDEEGAVRSDAIEEATGLFMDGKLLVRHGAEDDKDAIYSVPDERRIALEYYKNNVLHFFVSRALVSSALLELGGSSPEGKLRERVKRLSRLLKHELIYDTEVSFDESFDHTLTAMREDAEISIDEGRSVSRAQGPRGELLAAYASMITTYLESLLLALRGTKLLLEGRVDKKAWVKKTLAIGQRMYLAGELELRESLSKLRLENALLSLRDIGMVKLFDAGAIEIGDRADPDAIEQLESQLGAKKER